MADQSDTPISSEEVRRDRTTRRDLLRRAGIGAAAVAAYGAGSGGATILNDRVSASVGKPGLVSSMRIVPLASNFAAESQRITARIRPPLSGVVPATVKLSPSIMIFMREARGFTES